MNYHFLLKLVWIEFLSLVTEGSWPRVIREAFVYPCPTFIPGIWVIINSKFILTWIGVAIKMLRSKQLHFLVPLKSHTLTHRIKTENKNLRVINSQNLGITLDFRIRNSSSLIFRDYIRRLPQTGKRYSLLLRSWCFQHLFKKTSTRCFWRRRWPCSAGFCKPRAHHRGRACNWLTTRPQERKERGRDN